MAVSDFLTVTGLLLGSGFFLAGAVGLLRFPDLYTRLHALTKVDNLGLALVVIALLFQVDTWIQALKLLLIWLLVLLASAASSYLVARSARKKRIAPWTR